MTRSPNLRRYLDHPFWQALGLLVLAYLVIVYGVPLLPGSSLVPSSVVLQYMVTVLVGVLIYVSDNDERWALFKQPLVAMLVEQRLRLVRILVLAVVTLLVGWVTFGQVRTTVAAPPNLRSLQDNGTIAQLTESFVFWRVAKGGPGLPREGTPWNSAMPRWEDFLTERQIWAVILFLYDQTGWKPRTWEKAEGGAK